jgi:hypothetical protein
MNVGLDGMVILITGAARGIGAAIAEQAAQAGAEALVLVDRDGIDLDLPCAVEIGAADLALPDAPKEAIAAALARFGRIDGLVNAAGLTTRGGFRRRDGWDQEPHVLGQHARALLPDGRGHRRHEGAGRAGVHRQHPVDERPLRRAGPRRLFGHQGRAADPHEERGECPSGRAHPGERDQSRLDGYGNGASTPRGHAGPGRRAGWTRRRHRSRWDG